MTLVTGGAGGLGSSISRQLLVDGHFVIINFKSSVAEAIKLRDEFGQMCDIMRADVSSRREVAEMARYIESKFSRLDNLINNAGTIYDDLLIKYPEPEWDRVIDINLKGCFNCMQALSPLINNAGGGHIVNISSFSGIKGKEGQSAYSAAKAGIIGLGKTAAFELAHFNIKVNTVLPGYMETKMGRKSVKAVAHAKKESILKRLSDPEEVARFISYLCTTDNITGQVFTLDSRII